MKKIVTKPMRIMTQNYWKVRRPHIITKWLDIDKDNVPDYKDCKPLDPTKQHSRTWQKKLLASELVKRDQPEEFLSEMRKGWKEEKVVSRMKKKPGSNLLKIQRRYERVSQFPDAIAFCAEDIKRTKDVEEFIIKHNLKDLWSEIQF